MAKDLTNPDDLQVVEVKDGATVKLDKDSTVNLGKDAEVTLGKGSVVKLSDDSVAAIASAFAGEDDSSQASEVVASLSEQDTLALHVCAYSSLCLVFALCVTFGFLLVHKLVTPLRVRHD